MIKDDKKKRQLGRGLSALLGDEEEDYADLDRVRLSKMVPIEFVEPGPFQPRRHFDDEEISGLVDSIKEQGILQPILVRRHPDKPIAYEIIAGERRWRAAQKAKLHEVPIIIKDLSDGEALEISLVENLQRLDLNPLEEAEGYSRLIDEFSHSQEELGKAIGKSRSHIANMLRLLTLPDPIKEMLDQGALSAGHARALLGAENAEALARAVIKKGLNVRQTEELAQSAKGKISRKAKGKAEKDANTLALEKEVSSRLGLAVTISYHETRGGSLVIRYQTLDQLEDVLERLSHRLEHQETGSPEDAPAADEADVSGEEAAPEDMAAAEDMTEGITGADAGGEGDDMVSGDDAEPETAEAAGADVSEAEEAAEEAAGLDEESMAPPLELDESAVVEEADTKPAADEAAPLELDESAVVEEADTEPAADEAAQPSGESIDESSMEETDAVSADEVSADEEASSGESAEVTAEPESGEETPGDTYSSMDLDEEESEEEEGTKEPSP